MKLKKLDIKSYRHLEDVSFDFTYPEGHKNAGEPLKKICIIGQSATGKTSVLELIKDSLVKLNSVEIINGTSFFGSFNLNFKGELKYLDKDELLVIEETKITKNGNEFINPQEPGSGGISKLVTDGLRVLYFSSDIISKETIDIFNQHPTNIITILSDEKYAGLAKRYNQPNYIYEFLQGKNEELWYSILSKIVDYRKKFFQMASALLNKGTVGDLSKLNKEYSQWSDANKNPLISFANYFDPILKKLSLEIDLVNTEYSIPIKSKINEDIIPISGLSTGTKGLLLSMFPLFELDTTDSIILLDEPERSLFPDMQLDLITHYQNIAPHAQFLVATHSPFIAAAFEPEERFILYFKEDGKVAVRRGESPIGDDPNDILTNDFKVDYYNGFGKKAYQDYLSLKAKLAQETELEKKKKLVVELAELGDKYNF